MKERLERLRDPELRARIIAERPPIEGELAVLRMILAQGFDRMFRLMTPTGPDYEPAPETSVAAIAAREGRDAEEVIYDLMLEREGRALLMIAVYGYSRGSLESIREMLAHPRSAFGLGDGGAHCARSATPA